MFHVHAQFAFGQIAQVAEAGACHGILSQDRAGIAGHQAGLHGRLHNHQRGHAQGLFSPCRLHNAVVDGFTNPFKPPGQRFERIRECLEQLLAWDQAGEHHPGVALHLVGDHPSH